MKVAIVGFSESSRGDAPYKDPEWQIWGCNHLYPYIPRWDRWFEIHTLAYLKTLPFWEKDYEQWLMSSALDTGKIVYVNGRDGFATRGAVPYPLDTMLARYGSYFTSTVAYMLALAIAEIGYVMKTEIDANEEKLTVHEIGMWGTDMTHDTEWEWQRACVERLVGIAQGMGIKVAIPETSALLRCPWLYGFEDEPGEYAKITEGIAREDAAIRQKHEKAIIDMATHDGYRQALAWMKRRVREMKRGATF